jgi:hypothetical protein
MRFFVDLKKTGAKRAHLQGQSCYECLGWLCDQTISRHTPRLFWCLCDIWTISVSNLGLVDHKTNLHHPPSQNIKELQRSCVPSNINRSSIPNPSWRRSPPRFGRPGSHKGIDHHPQSQSMPCLVKYHMGLAIWKIRQY